MKLQDYIRGRRKGRDARQVELDSMADPFLGEALEGYDAVDADHGAALDRLSARLAERTRQGNPRLDSRVTLPARRPVWRRPGLWASVASLAIVFGISVVFYRNFMTEPKQVAYDYVPVLEEEIMISRVPTDAVEESIPEPHVPVVVPEVINIVANDVEITVPLEISFAEFSEDMAILSAAEEWESPVHEEAIPLPAAIAGERELSLHGDEDFHDEVVVIAYGTQKKRTALSDAAITDGGESESRLKRIKTASGMNELPQLSDRDQSTQPSPVDFIATGQAPTSRFGLNTEGESYRKIQGLINQAKKPAPEDVNTGELVNYFYYTYQKPAGNEAVNISYEIGDCPWNPANKLVIITAGATDQPGNGKIGNLDLKVNFNPANVSSYRLVGNEEMEGAQGGGSLLAMYEVVPAAGSDTVGNIMNLDLSYKEKGSRRAKSIQKDVRLTGIPPSDNFWFASAVAMFGEILKGSIDTGEAGYDIVIENAGKGLNPQNAGARLEFIKLVETAKELAQ